MKILSIDHALPGRKVDNEDMLAMIRARSPDLAPPAWAAVQDRLRRFWSTTGTRRRYILADGEPGLDVMAAAVERAIATAGVDRGAIDLVVYVGVGRGVIEPAMASAVQRRLGLSGAACFDVLEACQSWLRALQVVRGLLSTGDATTALIVNCETGLQHLCDFRVDDVADVDRILAATTIGEAATATIVTGGGDDDFYFRFHSLGAYFDTCMIPLPGYTAMMGASATPAPRVGEFHADTAGLIRVMAIEISKAFKRDPRLLDHDADIVFFHQASERLGDYVRRQMGISDELCVHTHADYGNTVSATVPLSMSLAIADNRWKRGHRTLVVTGAAGVSIGFALFTF